MKSYQNGYYIMTNYILDATILKPLLNGKPQQAIVLCHGYGGDGKDISVLASNWQRFLPKTVFLSPNAPEVCGVNPQGFQWFDLSSDKDEEILEKSLIAEDKLNTFLNQILDNYQLEPKKIVNDMFVLQAASEISDNIECDRMWMWTLELIVAEKSWQRSCEVGSYVSKTSVYNEIKTQFNLKLPDLSEEELNLYYFMYNSWSSFSSRYFK